MKELIEKLKAEALKIEQMAKDCHEKKDYEGYVAHINRAMGIYISIIIVQEDYKKDNPF